MSKKLISCCFSSIRPANWKMVYQGLCNTWWGTDIDVEMVVSGPIMPDFKLPPNLKYIKTENIKPAQCEEITFREAQGDFILIGGDDLQFVEGSPNTLYLDYMKRMEKSGDKLIILSREISQKRYRPNSTDNNWRTAIVNILPFNRSSPISPGDPICGLGMALVERKYFDEIGGIDKRFIGSYWHLDVALRFYQANIKIEWSDAALFIERIDMPQSFPRLHRRLRKHERIVLDKLWVRSVIPGEPVPSDVVHSHYQVNCGTVLSKIRLDPVVQEFNDKDIKLYSQGPKEWKGNIWV